MKKPAMGAGGTQSVASHSLAEPERPVKPQGGVDMSPQATNGAHRAILRIISNHPAAVKQLVDTYRRGKDLPEWVLRLGFDVLATQLEPEEVAELRHKLNLDMTAGTGKVFGHQQRYIVKKGADLVETLRVPERNKSLELRAQSRLYLPKGVEPPTPEEVLQRIQDTLLKRKANGASLLKTHLWLVDRAYRAGGEEPTFTVDIDELLQAKGYKRRQDGTFHPDTYREEFGRIMTLASSWITLWEVKGKGRKAEKYVDETPYWEVRARRRLEDGDTLGHSLQPYLLADAAPPIVKQAIIQPGLWWRVSQIGQYHLKIPRAILELPTDGRGNERERLAVRLAATLTLWVRASQNQHAGKARPYSVGALLEGAGVTTREEFDALHRVSAMRLRHYLAGDDGMSGSGGALDLLRLHGGFEIDIQDKADFWASGRRWQDRFWEARLTVTIPDLQLGRK